MEIKKDSLSDIFDSVLGKIDFKVSSGQRSAFGDLIKIQSDKEKLISKTYEEEVVELTNNVEELSSTLKEAKNVIKTLEEDNSKLRKLLNEALKNKNGKKKSKQKVPK